MDYNEKLIDSLADMLAHMPEEAPPEWRQREAAWCAFDTLYDLVEDKIEMSDVVALWEAIWGPPRPDAGYESIRTRRAASYFEK